MRFFLMLGGLTGFVLAFIASLHGGNAPAFALRDGGIGCLAGAAFLRGLHAVLIWSIRSNITERATAAAAKRAAETVST